jgi:flagellar basal-body rod protein FlgG
MEDNFFRTTEESERADFNGRVHQGFLENSNSNIVNEMVQMIALSRAFETNSRIVTIQDQTLQRAVNDIAGR